MKGLVFDTIDRVETDCVGSWQMRRVQDRMQGEMKERIFLSKNKQRAQEVSKGMFVLAALLAAVVVVVDVIVVVVVVVVASLLLQLLRLFIVRDSLLG